MTQLASACYVVVVFSGLLIMTCCGLQQVEMKTKMTEHTADNAATVPSATSCIEPLKKLAIGDYTTWHGLSAVCTRANVSAALGESKSDNDLYGNLGGTPTVYRVYPGVSASPYGVTVWYVEDLAVALQMHTVTPARPIEEQLGAPEAKDPSLMPGFKTMWIYASRGLTLHIDDGSGAIAWLYGYRPMTLAEFRSSWLSRVEILRHRVR